MIIFHRFQIKWLILKYSQYRGKKNISYLLRIAFTTSTFVALMYDGTSKERRKENMARVQITRRKTSMKIVNSKQPRANLALTLNTANIQLVTLIITSTRFCFPIYSAIQPFPGSRWKSLLFLILHVSTFRIRFDTEFRYVVR